MESAEKEMKGLREGENDGQLQLQSGQRVVQEIRGVAGAPDGGGMQPDGDVAEIFGDISAKRRFIIHHREKKKKMAPSAGLAPAYRCWIINGGPIERVETKMCGIFFRHFGRGEVYMGLLWWNWDFQRSDAGLPAEKYSQPF
ncbi:NADH dehydrogenase 1 beta subcomplex subunit 3 [Striga asiatica]|uniref:NADH dehydrogenase 1 beta subcomplex subunit 3 n=1 Tax=Striga asiatica TaxID=4170 RepID=A0A5A7R0N8_STRAF|nr:NADH dehydrogenase 1 beta subcomplex subunit 3 [Striga asiatica]